MSEELSFFIKSPIDAQVLDVRARVNESVDPSKIILNYDCSDIKDESEKKLASAPCMYAAIIKALKIFPKAVLSHTRVQTYLH